MSRDRSAIHPAAALLALVREYVPIDPCLRRQPHAHFHAVLFRDEASLRARGAAPAAQAWWLWREGRLLEIDEPSFWEPLSEATLPAFRPAVVDLRIAPLEQGRWIAHYLASAGGFVECLELALSQGDDGLEREVEDILYFEGPPSASGAGGSRS